MRCVGSGIHKLLDSGNGNDRTRRERHMEAVLKNLGSSVELLAVAAHSCVVEQWDKQTLTRAFHWAHYCENLFSRFHKNAAIRRIMEKQLQLTNQTLGATFPAYSEISFSDLSQCQHLLLVGLLNNPDLPVSIIKILFDSEKTAHAKEREYQDVTGLCSRIVLCKSACKLLSPLTDLSAVGAADAEVQGAMLMERLGALLSQGSEACEPELFLDSILQGREGEAEHFCLVIAAALLTTKNSDAETAAQDFLLDWLRKKHKLLQHMCSSLPPKLLTKLAKEQQTFRNSYCEVLKKWASDMEYSVTEGEWVQTGTNQTVSFQKLTEHFLALFSTCPSQRKDVEKELKALKLYDGYFDVRGLSVWGDLLSALNS
ncbi:Fanconi anemia group F protein [Xyrichtys novacula]|uniref:Fanconi anemia group F protein n=1 Tax=Xyrichtys novacula TaxID=13765 RepID=A0AAV1F714_XYRNO|nr:Fanconi anemia group F protein [Xyrichtys novacula]